MTKNHSGINMNTRIEVNDTLGEIAEKMSEGNIGAYQLMIRLLTLGRLQDIITLDSIVIYSENIFCLWKDCCKCDIDKFVLVLQNFTAGELTKEFIMSNIKSGKEFEKLKTKEELYAEWD